MLTTINRAKISNYKAGSVPFPLITGSKDTFNEPNQMQTVPVESKFLLFGPKIC